MIIQNNLQIKTTIFWGNKNFVTLKKYITIIYITGQGADDFVSKFDYKNS